MANVMDHNARFLLCFRLHLASYALLGERLTVSKVAQVERCDRHMVKDALEWLGRTGCVEELQARKGRLSDREYVVSTDCFHLRPMRGDDGGLSPEVVAASEEMGEPARGRFLGEIVPDRLVHGSAVRDKVLQRIYEGASLEDPTSLQKPARHETEPMKAAVLADRASGHRMDHAFVLGGELVIWNRGLYARAHGSGIVTFGDVGIKTQPTGADVMRAIREMRRLPRDVRAVSMQEIPISPQDPNDPLVQAFEAARRRRQEWSA
ncbi:MAG: hypothetical protein QOE90_2345 [Thermoplasmata archaeon]|jgi:hypothetical protein|nr:hypothetical protein [Thermoplasmata archaeon]